MLCRCTLLIAALVVAHPCSAFGKAPNAAKARKRAAAAAPIVSQPAGTILLAESFAAEHGKGWRTAKGKWEIIDGAWRGAELKSDNHGAVARHNLGFTDVVIDFDFKLDGARGISLSINDPKGHNSRLSISSASVAIAKDDHDHEGPDKRAMLGSTKTAFEPDKWYHARITQIGESFEAQVGDVTLKGKHADIAVGKSNIGFTVAGETASFKNLKVQVPSGQ